MERATSFLFSLKHWKWVRLSILLTMDLLLIGLSYVGAFWLRFDNWWSSEYSATFLTTLPLLLLISVPTFIAGGMYRQIWRFAGVRSALTVIRCAIVASLLFMTMFYLLRPVPGLPPRSIYILQVVLAIVALGVPRFLWRLICSFRAAPTERQERERCIIYGAGSGGDLIARHIAANAKFPLKAVGFIDDDKNKVGRVIHGLRVFGTGSQLAQIGERLEVKTVVLAMPSVSGRVIREAVERCQRANFKTLIMPDMANALGEEVFKPRAVDIGDLLRRAPKSIDHDKVKGMFEGRSVLVTGAGGSIGSEICRQVLTYRPKKLVVLDSAEFNLYQIESELRDCGAGGCLITPVLASTVDRRAIKQAFDEHSPEIVLHAAAYKHVPIIEANPLTGIINNVLGTLIVAKEAQAAGVKNFVLISTDKAVAPTSVMGATKRCCELLVQALYALEPRGCSFCSVRFGNVLGSSGSVVPRFLQQIQSGGPVTVTHPEMTRYFMLTSEAVGLVLQASTISRGGEVFVLNMGEPVKIYDMAQQLIRLAGKEPGRDIEIVFTGVRPGEKLHEELIIEGAERKTAHEDLLVARPLPIEPRPLLDRIDRLVSEAIEGNAEAAISTLWSLGESGALRRGDRTNAHMATTRFH